VRTFFGKCYVPLNFFDLHNKTNNFLKKIKGFQLAEKARFIEKFKNVLILSQNPDNNFSNNFENFGAIYQYQDPINRFRVTVSSTSSKYER